MYVISTTGKDANRLTLAKRTSCKYNNWCGRSLSLASLHNNLSNRCQEMMVKNEAEGKAQFVVVVLCM